MSAALVDPVLRRRALAILGPHGDSLAREALEKGELLLEPPTKSWEGSHGMIHGHRVVARTPALIHRRLSSPTESHSARDGLHGAIAAALAERGGHTLVDLVFDEGDVGPGGEGGPYRT